MTNQGKPQSGVNITTPFVAGQQLTEETALRMIAAVERNIAVRQARKSKLAVALGGVLGFILVMDGGHRMMDKVSFFEHFPYAEFLLGLGILAIFGVFFEKTLGSEIEHVFKSNSNTVDKTEKKEERNDP